VLWVTFDTPVDDEDRADTQFVMQRIRDVLPLLDDDSVVLVSSQLPVESCRELESMFASDSRGRRVGFACSPENLRLGKAIDVFRNPDRVVVGVRAVRDRQILQELLAPITSRVEWMSVESAEMAKHALNAFLAISVTFANEIAALCERVGADAKEVERGLKTEARIGPGAYLSPGAAFAGGTLARDVAFLIAVGDRAGVTIPLLGAVRQSNDNHRGWPERKLEELLGRLHGRTVAVWGLTYKPGTDTLRRSSAVELCRRLSERGATVRAHDPAVRDLPRELQAMRLCASAEEAALGAEALVVMTGWPQYRQMAIAPAINGMKEKNVIDPARVLPTAVVDIPGVRYVSVGTPCRVVA
jgi:UDPglucose 6-dehydrogenase